MMNTEILRQGGIDYIRGVERYLNDAEMYEMLLCDFCADDQMARSEEAFSQKDNDALLSVAHEVKGTASNLDMERLYAASSVLVAALRDPEANKEDVDALYKEYRRVFAESKEAVAKATAGV